MLVNIFDGYAIYAIKDNTTVKKNVTEAGQDQTAGGGEREL